MLHEDADIVIVDKPAGVPSLAGVGPGLSSKNDAVAILNAARSDAARSDDALFEESAERVAGTKRGREEEEEEEEEEEPPPPPEPPPSAMVVVMPSRRALRTAPPVPTAGRKRSCAS